MATDVLDENHFQNQCSLYETSRVQIADDTLHHSTTTLMKPPPPPPPTITTTTAPSPSSTTKTTVLNTPPMSATNHNRRVKYPTQTTMSAVHTLSNSIHHRHSGSTDIFTFIRSFAMKPFKTSSMTNAVAGGETSNVIGGSNIRNKSSVSLLRYRPLSDVLTDHTSYIQSTHAIEEFLRRMEWSVSSANDETRVKWNTAVKFLIPTKYDVYRAIDLYKTHENLRKVEKLDRIWIKNPYLIREIESSKFFTMPQIPTQPLTVIFTASNLNYLTCNENLAAQEPELLTLQALICQLDVATESIEAQQNGLNFIYDMQNCLASQFNISLSKKILKFLQGGYPAMVKNIYVVSAPKWFRVIYKVTFYTAEQMCECLRTEYGYSLDSIPLSLGGNYDPVAHGSTRYQYCLSRVTNSQSICYPFYSTDCQSMSMQPPDDYLLIKIGQNNYDRPLLSSKKTRTPSPVSILRFVSSRRNRELTSSQIHMRKRESSSSSDNEKRRRSNENLNELELLTAKSSKSRKENIDDRLKHSDNGRQSNVDRKEKSDNHAKHHNSMNENGHRESKCESHKRIPTARLYKPLTEEEFFSKTHAEIRQEFRRLPNPPAKDTHAARYEENLEKSRYRDVIPGELTRVKLEEDDEDTNDFINANYVSGYNNAEKAYIFTQGPLQSTVKDFWRMIWQENISIIVMTTNIRESGTMKCYPYWPLQTNDSLSAGSYQVYNEKSDKYDSFVITTLLLQKKNCTDVRTVYHAHYLKWPDHGVPSGTKDALAFLEKVEDYKKLTGTIAPVLLHCSAGIGRTGTFCAIDIGIKRYRNEKTIDIPSTVIKMRHERAGSVQTEDQYLFTYLALMDYITEYKIIQEKLRHFDLSNSKATCELDQTIQTSLTDLSKVVNLKESVSERIETFDESALTNIGCFISPTLHQSSIEQPMPLTN